MELNRTCPEHDAGSPHPAYTYFELYTMYLSCIDHINGPSVGLGDQIMSLEPTRLRPDSFDAFKKMISKSRVQEIGELVDRWENIKEREQEMLINLAELRQESRWGTTDTLFEE